MRLHAGTLLAGLIYLATGVVFILEALEVWTMQVGDLRLVLPLAMVAAGMAVVIGSITRTRRAE
jgi:hypothetical protein